MKNEDNEFYFSMLKYVQNMETRKLAELTVQKLANELNMSQSSLYDLFHSRGKNAITPKTFIDFSKIVRADALMRKHKRLSIKQIAKILGFSSSSYFARFYKKMTGQTPLQEKKKIHEEDLNVFDEPDLYDLHPYDFRDIM